MPATKMKSLHEAESGVEDLGAELFDLVQNAQGRGFVSDGISYVDGRAQFFRIVRGHLQETERAARLIRKFLKKYGEGRA